MYSTTSMCAVSIVHVMHVPDLHEHCPGGGGGGAGVQGHKQRTW